MQTIYPKSNRKPTELTIPLINTLNLSETKKMNILIVEDEPLARAEMRRQLKALRPNATITAEAESVEQAVQALAQHEPDLIFMDIQLADGQSFEIFEQTDVKAPVIFTTAYDSFAIKAFKVNSIDYLLKPIEPEQLQAAIEKFETRQAQRQPAPLMDVANMRQLLGISATQVYKTRFVTQLGERIRFVQDHEVAYFKSEDEVVFAVTHEGKRNLINLTLEKLEREIDQAKFFRINRQYIVSLASLGDIHKYFNARLKLRLTPDPTEEVLVSRNRVTPFMTWIGN